LPRTVRILEQKLMAVRAAGRGGGATLHLPLPWPDHGGLNAPLLVVFYWVVVNGQTKFTSNTWDAIGSVDPAVFFLFLYRDKFPALLRVGGGGRGIRKGRSCWAEKVKGGIMARIAVLGFEIFRGSPAPLHCILLKGRGKEKREKRT